MTTAPDEFKGHTPECNCSQEDVHDYGPCGENCRSLIVQNAASDSSPFEGATPGPWHLINDCCVGGPIEPGWEAAGCGVAHCGMRARTPEEAAANARLIAAAPDLLSDNIKLREALEKIASCTSHHPGDVVAIARTALSTKTKGET